MIAPASPQSTTPARPVRIGYLLRMYPRFSQTFVVNEILELERQGLDLHIVSMRKPDEGIFHESVSRVAALGDRVLALLDDFGGFGLSSCTGATACSTGFS